LFLGGEIGNVLQPLFKAWIGAAWIGTESKIPSNEQNGGGKNDAAHSDTPNASEVKAIKN
jgi:hypothetical protein